MCGFTGEIRFDDTAPDEEPLRRAVDALRPRGPDGEGTVLRGRVALGHRRLKIIDLSDAAAQPMVDPDTGVAIAYNGALYNYPELRRELQTRGRTFRSSGDTEVILHAWQEWGDAAVERFQGMFAFAIHDPRSGRLTLARDRLGIKPLYTAPVDGGMRFASSLPALLAAGGVDTALDPRGLHHYFSFHAVVPAPVTVLRGVRKVPPATLVHVDADGTVERRTYWELRFGPREGDRERSEPEWTELLEQTLRTAVDRRMIADVPVGVLLSGGLDSSLIVGLLAEGGQKEIETFSIGFESVGDEKGDEFEYSDQVVERFATNHHKIRIGGDTALTQIEACVDAMSEPMVSHDNIGFFLLSREVSRYVKVVQSGQGADEVFAGYHWYPPLLESRDPLEDYRRLFFDRDQAEMSRLLDDDFLDGDPSLEFVRGHFDRPGAERGIDKALRLDTTVMLVEDPVKRVDNHTMASGLEARVPFLDHEVVELAARIPAELKVAGGGKHLLKEVARGIIPDGVIDRPKGYFPVPALKYLQGTYLQFVRDVLTDPRARRRGVYRADHVEHLLADPESHITPLRGSKLWQLALLELWLQRHGL